MKIKKIAIMILMITILMIPSIKVEATETQEEIEPTTTNVKTELSEDDEYTLNKEIEIKPIPLINSKTKTTISGKIKIIEKINNWYRIETDTEIGWIREKMLKNVTTEEVVQEPKEQPEKQPEEQPQEQPQEEKKESEIKKTNKIGYVTTEGLTVREGPTVSSKEIDGLSQNDKVEIIGEVDGWYKIKIDEGTGYVSAKYISDKKVVETTSRSGSSLKQPNVTPMEETTTEETQNDNKNTTSTETKGVEVVEYAKQFLGCRYVPGGSSPTTGFDCSGFTTYVYKHFGISLNRSSKGQINNGVAVSRNNLQLGDIVIFNNSRNTAIGHVGIYIGGNKFIHAANSKEGVTITSLSSSYYNTRFVGARRVI